MKVKLDTISEKITLLNDTILDSMAQGNDKVIIKNFTETAIRILGADFGFTWWKFSSNTEYKLAYKSPTTPYEPFTPRSKASHFTALKTKKPYFDDNVKKEKYGSSDISPFMKSFVIIPISHGNHLYGSITVCYKKRHNFSKEELTLAQAIGSTTAQALTIYRLILSEKESQKKALAAKNLELSLKEEKQKIEFITNANHELRTPLAIIKGNVDLAMQGKNTPSGSTKDSFKAINSEINHLSSILSDLSLITSNKEKLKSKVSFEKVNLKSLVVETIERCKVLAHKKNIALIYRNIPNINIYGDRTDLERMLINLITNSIIYGKKNGHTRIEIKKSEKSVTICIIDDGIGISKKDLPHVFERFYRTDKSRNLKGNRAGLGLSIVKWTAEMHRGNVSVQSKEDQGSTFTVNLPIKPRS